MIAVTTAAKVPKGVRDLCEIALYTSASVAGTAISCLISEYRQIRKVESLGVGEEECSIMSVAHLPGRSGFGK